MISPKYIEQVTMTKEKKESAQNDLFAFYIGRPLSYVLTVPFLYTSISPNQVSIFSIFILIIGFFFMAGGKSIKILSVGWICFFVWNLLDGVDGNIARFKKQFSELGSVYDAMSGYVAMALSFFGWGVAAYHNCGLITNILNIKPDIYIILGALSGYFTLFPRLIMHKTISLKGPSNSTNLVKDKSSFSPLKVLVLNLVSTSGFAQVFMLLAIIFQFLDIFTIGYCVLNFLIMLISLISILREK